jgi:hypothetical protein
MIARRTRRISSSLFPLNITPAMTSIHPPAWWNGPLGPLTTGRDLYGEDLRGSFCPAVRHDVARRAGLSGVRRDHEIPDQGLRDHEILDQALRGSVDDRLSGSQNGLFPPCHAHHGPRLAGLGSLRR